MKNPHYDSRKKRACKDCGRDITLLHGRRLRCYPCGAANDARRNRSRRKPTDGNIQTPHGHLRGVIVDSMRQFNLSLEEAEQLVQAANLVLEMTSSAPEGGVGYQGMLETKERKLLRAAETKLLNALASAKELAGRACG